MSPLTATEKLTRLRAMLRDVAVELDQEGADDLAMAALDAAESIGQELAQVFAFDAERAETRRRAWEASDPKARLIERLSDFLNHTDRYE